MKELSNSSRHCESSCFSETWKGSSWGQKSSINTVPYYFVLCSQPLPKIIGTDWISSHKVAIVFWRLQNIHWFYELRKVMDYCVQETKIAETNQVREWTGSFREKIVRKRILKPLPYLHGNRYSFWKTKWVWIFMDKNIQNSVLRLCIVVWPLPGKLNGIGIWAKKIRVPDNEPLGGCSLPNSYLKILRWGRLTISCTCVLFEIIHNHSRSAVPPCGHPAQPHHNQTN